MEAIEAMMTRISPIQLIEPGPSADQLQTILATGARAPDHGMMKPWRFVVIEGESRKRFGELMAQSLLRREPDSPPTKLDGERAKAMRAPTIIIVAAAVKESPKVPDIEQIVAVGAASQNILIAAHALGLGGFWRTGPIAYDDDVKVALGLNKSDTIVGIMYLGSVKVAGPVKTADVATVTRHW
jgi:nitroreductase